MNNSDLDEIIFEINPRLKQFPQLLLRAKQAIRELIDKKVEEAVEDALWNERVGNE
jgi:hypothetical protein